ncbi:helix-turn-helix transcriptional regulator [Mycobacterium sp.]|uniref:helix-turn-helix transcriptional regulator n=1 Tax=Mycobacterium sp. TaxID=1785 RepID=UPI0025DD4E25|nr:helix-turn-helix transcriptional regulator [Mycobacterium sp.]MBW0014852.1 helix-turn-helix transcriptional regulator [Mycobacterium sp.]
MTSYGGDLIREARRRAGLTQAQLASDADTTQSAIARWESGRTAVSLDDVRRLVRLCGFELELMLVPRDDSDMAQAKRLAGLSGQERIERHARVARQLTALRQAGRS